MFTIIKLAITLLFILLPLLFAGYCIYTSFANRFGTPFAERINLTNSNRAFIYSFASFLTVLIALAIMPLIEEKEAQAIAAAKAAETQAALLAEAKAQGFSTIKEYKEWQQNQLLEKKRRAEAERTRIYSQLDQRCHGIECSPIGNGVRFFMPKSLVEWIYPSCKNNWQPAYSKFFVGSPTTEEKTVIACQVNGQQKLGENLLSNNHNINITLYKNQVARIELIETEIPEKFLSILSANNYQQLGEKRFPNAYGTMSSAQTATNKTLLELNYREGSASAICNPGENGTAVRIVFIKEDATLKTYAYQCGLLNQAEQEAIELEKNKPESKQDNLFN